MPYVYSTAWNCKTHCNPNCNTTVRSALRNSVSSCTGCIRFRGSSILLQLVYSLPSSGLSGRKQGDLSLLNGRQLMVLVSINKHPEHITIQIDTGSSYSQIDSATAVQLGLKSHPKLLGLSQIGDGSTKADYLCATTVTVLGVEVPLVIKVGPSQPSLLGLDAMFSLSMNLNLSTLKFDVAKHPTLPPTSTFGFLSFPKLLSQNKLQQKDLVPIQDLPPPEDQYQSMRALGTAHSVINLGTTMSFRLPSAEKPRVINLGSS